MPNIMLTDRCNLKCPYCFANEFVNKATNEITKENFLKAIDFLFKDGSCRDVGLIGGEPTLHKQFRDLLQLVINDTRIPSITIYTNGLLLNNFWDEMQNEKIYVLVNCNAPKDMGESRYRKLCDNISYMVEKLHMKHRVALGINIYNSNFEYDYMLKLLEKNQFQNVRVSITVPNTSESILPEAKEYFLIYKKRVHTFFLELLNRNIIPFYDCNKLPFCFLTEEEKQQYIQFESIMDTQPYDKSDIRSEVVQCSPVIDILQDLTAVRCFGLSQSTKVKISDFENLTDLKNYYRWSIDDLAYHREIMPECKNCYEYKTKKCMGGCIVFKLNKILALRQMINQNNV